VTILNVFVKCQTETVQKLLYICLYGVGLCSKYSDSSMIQFKDCYHRRIKMFFSVIRSIIAFLLFCYSCSCRVFVLIDMLLMYNEIYVIIMQFYILEVFREFII